jgi:inosine triphosphate pyrophosphatase
MHLTFVTGNENKLKEVLEIINIPIESRKLDLLEIQGTTQEISIHKCKQAAEIIGGPVLVEDTCLGFDAFNGLPGPYIKWFLQSLGPDLHKMLLGFDTSGFALCTFAYCKGSGEPVLLFEGKTEGSIVPPRGPGTFGWDNQFQPRGYDQTYAEMPKELKNTLSHRFKALQKLQQHFKQQ